MLAEQTRLQHKAHNVAGMCMPIVSDLLSGAASSITPTYGAEEAVRGQFGKMDAEVYERITTMIVNIHNNDWARYSDAAQGCVFLGLEELAEVGQAADALQDTIGFIRKAVMSLCSHFQRVGRVIT